MNRTPEILAELRKELAAVPPCDLPAIIGQIEAVKAEAFVMLMAPTPVPVEREPEDDSDRLLSTDEVATRLGQTSQWVRAHKHELPRVILTGSRSLRFSEKRIATMIKRRSYG